MAIDDTRHPTERRSNNSRIVLIILAMLAIVALAWAAGFFNVETEGALTAPEVSVSGGSVPEVSVNTADIDVGTRQEEVTVPTVEITPAKD